MRRHTDNTGLLFEHTGTQVMIWCLMCIQLDYFCYIIFFKYVSCTLILLQEKNVSKKQLKVHDITAYKLTTGTVIQEKGFHGDCFNATL